MSIISTDTQPLHQGRTRFRFARLGLVLMFVGLVHTPTRTAGRQFYAAPEGMSTNDGTITRPLDLATALSSNSPAGPGDTIWVRGGVYQGAFTSQLVGTADSPIVVRNYNGERATIDLRSGTRSALTIAIDARHTWYWGLEVMSSGTKRRTWRADTEELDRSFAVRNNGTDTKLINNVIHDAALGISNWGLWDTNPGLEAYGNLVYYNGWEQTPNGRGRGHGTYTTSKPEGPTVLKDNIVHSNFSQGIRMGDDGVFSPHIEGNISYLNGAHMHRFGNGRNIYVAGSNQSGTTYQPMTGAVIQNNYTYHRTGNAQYVEGLNAGLWWPGASGRILHNYLAGAGGGDTLKLGYENHFTARPCEGNTVYGPVNAYTRQQCPPESNTYFTSKPTTNAVFVRPNQYEAGRANIVVYNWRQFGSVDVNISDARLTNGQRFEVRDAMNFYGGPLVTGTYSTASPIVSIPMTGLTRAPLAGEDDITPEYRPASHSAPEFGAFILLPVGSS